MGTVTIARESSLLEFFESGGWILPVKPRASKHEASREASDEELVHALAHGDREAFAVIYYRYTGAVLGYVKRMLGGNRALSEDIAQLAWEKMVRAAPEFSDKSFTAWLFTIVRNTTLDELRRQGRWKSEAFDEEEDAHNPDEPAFKDPEELLAQFAEDHELRNRIDKLPDRQRVAVVAWIESDLGQKELAAQLGMTAKAFRMLLVRARKNLTGDQDEN